MQSMLLSMLRVLLPSWNFFDRAGDQFELQYQDSSKAWVNFFEPVPACSAAQMIYNGFLNSSGNLRLAYKSSIDRFMSEAQGLTQGQIVELESYQFIQRMISFEKGITTFKFRILVNGEVIYG